MNFQLLILLAIAAFAFALPVPDEEVSTLQKSVEVIETTTCADETTKAKHSLVDMEEGTNAIVANVTVETVPRVEIESEMGKPTEGKLTTTTIADDKIEVPKSLPVMAGIVPPVSEVRAEPKEGVEMGESKSTASSPDVDEVETKSEPKTTEEVQATTESLTGSVEKNEETPSTEEKPKTESTENNVPAKPAASTENKTEDLDAATTTTEPKQNDKTDPKVVKSGESTKEKHDESSEEKKSEESAESKESEESNENKKN